VLWARRSTGFDHVVAGGLCSGAYNAFHAALNGTELDDILLVNPGTFYVTAGDIPVEDTVKSAHFLTHGFFNGRKWKMALRDAEVRRQGVKSVRRLFENKAISGLRVLVVESARDRARRFGLPVKNTSMLARDLETILGQGCKIFLAFSPAEYADRYFRTFGGTRCQELAEGDRFELVYFDGGDHVFAPVGARRVLIDRMTEYLIHEHPVVATGAAPDTLPETRRVSGSCGSLGLSTR
jgi:hypothetical protein